VTAIVAIFDRGQVFFGADSAVTAGQDRRLTREPKIWKAGNALMGAAGCGEWCRSLRRLKWPDDVTLEWLADQLPKLKIKGNGELLIGLSSGLYELDGGFDPFPHADPFAAIGSGSQPAIGSLYASRRMPPKRRLTTALEAAKRYTSFVMPPYRYLVL
jgi:ATP-dependent protease HslVU (ClpYQ) peptidase subunit